MGRLALKEWEMQTDDIAAGALHGVPGHPGRGLKRWARMTLAASALLLCSGAQALAEDEPPADAAHEILKNMSDYLGKLPNLSLEYSADVEAISHGGQTNLSGLKLQFASQGTVTLSRPGKMRATRTASYGDVEIISDGATMTVIGKRAKQYAQAGAPPTIEGLVDHIRDTTGAEFPGADLLFADVYRELSAPVETGVYIGKDIIDGVECDHVAFRARSVDWQLWVESGDKPIPRRYVITSKWVTGAPQYVLRITKWNDKPVVTADTFKFTPPAGFKAVEIATLDGIADIPPNVEVGGR